MSRSTIPAVAFFCLVMATARGQHAVVQQPSFQQFTTPATVLVPDGGATGLGAAGSAAAARNTYGPGPLGTSRAAATGGSRVEARVWVHDFEAMDEALLGADRPAPPTSRRPRTRPGPTSRPGLPVRQRAAR